MWYLRPPSSLLFCWLLQNSMQYVTVFENHTKSLIQHCERSELHLHCDSTLNRTKIDGKCRKLKCDIFGNFQIIWLCILQVTWIRHRDVHILTVGEYTYTTDQRFLARHNQNTDEWTLVIKYVQERDAGIYECQIPSRIPRSYPINLNIVGKCTTREKL